MAPPALKQSVAAVLCVLGLLQSQSGFGVGASPTDDKDAVAVLVRIRTAITGSPSRLVRACTLDGLARDMFNGVTGRLVDTQNPFEIRFEVPDKYLRMEDRTPGIRSHQGFQGTTVTDTWKALDPKNPGFMHNKPSELAQLQRSFAWIALSLLAETKTAFPMNPTKVHRSGPTGSLDLVGPDSLTVSLGFDVHTYLPTTLRYVDQVSIPGPPLTAEEKARGVMRPPGQLHRAEVSVTFEDRQKTDGVSIPRLIRRTSGQTLLEELRITNVVLKDSPAERWR